MAEVLRGKRFLSVMIVISLAAGFTVFLCEVPASGDEPIFARTREVSTQEAYLNLLRENAAFKKEREAIAEENGKLRTQNSGFAARVKDLESRVQFLTGKADTAENRLAEEKRISEETISALKAELDDERKKAQEKENNLDKQEYVRRYNDARNQLEGARKALSEMTAQRSQELVKTEEKIKGIVAENENLKIKMGKAHFNLGTLLFKAGDYEKSAYEYEQAITIMPNDPETSYNLAIVYDHYLDKPEKAKGYYEQYFRLEPNPGRKKQLKERIAENELLSVMNSYKIE